MLAVLNLNKPCFEVSESVITAQTHKVLHINEFKLWCKIGTGAHVKVMLRYIYD